MLWYFRYFVLCCYAEYINKDLLLFALAIQHYYKDVGSCDTWCMEHFRWCSCCCDWVSCGQRRRPSTLCCVLLSLILLILSSVVCCQPNIDTDIARSSSARRGSSSDVQFNDRNSATYHKTVSMIAALRDSSSLTADSSMGRRVLAKQ